MNLVLKDPLFLITIGYIHYEIYLFSQLFYSIINISQSQYPPLPPPNFDINSEVQVNPNKKLILGLC